MSLRMYLLMFNNQVRFAFARIITLFTCERLGWVVYLHVDSQVTSFRKSLAAYITVERLFSGVLPVMDTQLRVRCPRPTAHIAFKAFLPLQARVSLHMSIKISVVCCGIVALATFIGQFSGMLVHVHS